MAKDASGSKWIELWPEVGGIDSMIPPQDALNIDEKLTGTVAHVVAYVEVPDRAGRVIFSANPQHMFIYPTASGRYIVRFLDIPSDSTWPAAM